MATTTISKATAQKQARTAASIAAYTAQRAAARESLRTALAVALERLEWRDGAGLQRRATDDAVRLVRAELEKLQ